MNVNPYLIRYMDDQYVNAFLKEGTLMLSSIYKFTDAELGLRQDLDEGVISYTGSGYRVCGDVEDQYLVLCSSMSFHKSARCEKNLRSAYYRPTSFCLRNYTSVARVWV